MLSARQEVDKHKMKKSASFLSLHYFPSANTLAHAPDAWSHLVVGVIAAAAELVPALGAAEVHAAAFRQSILEPAVRTGCRRTTQSTKPLFKWDRLL